MALTEADVNILIQAAITKYLADLPRVAVLSHPIEDMATQRAIRTIEQLLKKIVKQ